MAWTSRGPKKKAFHLSSGGGLLYCKCGWCATFWREILSQKALVGCGEHGALHNSRIATTSSE
jgi:hypothetical protein